MKVTPNAHRFLQRLLITAIPTLLTASIVPGADYSTAVLADGPLAYYRLNDDTRRSNINKNVGSLGAAGNAIGENAFPFPGLIGGSGNRSLFFNSTARTMIRWNAALNPTNTQPFTVEAWFYPTSDQIDPGQAVIMNGYSYPGVDRQGWVLFQRAQDLTFAGKPGYEDVGWNFRMYIGRGSSTGLDVVSQVPFQIGKWTHVVTVYDPVDVTNATLTMYIDGVAANTNTWTGGASGMDPGYVANTDDHPPAEAVFGPALLSLGSYNNTQPGSNPYFGAVDEFAFYSTKLTPASILAHYQNGTNFNRSVPYDALVQSDKPVAYLRLDELPPGPDFPINMGDLKAGGMAANITTGAVRHHAPSALAGRTDDSAFAYHNRNGRSTTTIPWKAENNGLDPANPSTNHAGIPFTFEAWLRPMRDLQGGQAAFNNRWVGGTGRTGWVVFQRNPNLTYPPSEGHGWEFRMYSGFGTSGQDVRTETDYTVGEWGHFVVTWEPVTDNGDAGEFAGAAANGNHQYQGILTAYFNGVAVSSNTAARYAANRNPSETGSPAADLAVGSYNAASTIGNNPYEGDIDEVAIYNNYLLTPAQILAHYQAATNSNYGTNYETLVLTAAYDGAGTQRLMPATYLRFNDPAHWPAANSGTLGEAADGALVQTINLVAGPQSPAYAGFESSNPAVPLDGLDQWVSLNNPSGLSISNQITLEAWIKPDTVQGNPARIVSHGPPTISDFLSASPVPDNSVTNSPEVFLRIDGAGANYVVGSSSIIYTDSANISTNIHSASFPVPAADLGGSNWVHLVGTYDGANWTLYRNGAPVATNPAAVGALPVKNGDWAIGATGNGWTNNFAGSIDEVAIYNIALSPNRIAAHYSAGLAGALRLAISLTGSNVTITWSAGTLQQSDNVTGTYSDLLTAASPYTPPLGPSAKFYRLKQ